MERLDVEVAQRLAGAGVLERLEYVSVGAMGGLDEAWLPLAPLVAVTGFEPDPREYAALAEHHGRYFDYVILERRRPARLHVSRDPGKTSVFRPNLDLLADYPNVERFDVVDVLDVPAERVRTLDEVLDELRAGTPDFLAVDTQGSELQVLQGATACLERHVGGVKVEVEFLPIYQGQPLFAEVDGLMRAHGYELMDLNRVYWKRRNHIGFEGRGQLVFADALYLPSARRLAAAMGAGGEVPFDRALRCALVALVYGFHDYALWLLDAATRAFGGQRLLDEVRADILTFDDSFGGWSQRDGKLGTRLA